MEIIDYRTFLGHPESPFDRSPNRFSAGAATRVVIQFDGVINDIAGTWNGEENLGDVATDADTMIADFLALDPAWTVCIVTERKLEYVRDFLIEQGLDSSIEFLTNLWIPAAVYVGDRTLTYDGDPTLLAAAAEAFAPHWTPAS
jgi:hypothetical protein